MIIDGKFSLKAPIQKVWDFILKPGTLAACIPGAEKVEQIDDKTYECIVKQSVGPISAKFKFNVIMQEVNPPTHVKATGQGADLSKLGTFSANLIVDLREIDKDETEIAYKVDVNIVGKLATFGERIMRAKAKQVGEEFSKNLQNKLKEIT